MYVCYTQSELQREEAAHRESKRKLNDQIKQLEIEVLSAKRVGAQGAEENAKERFQHQVSFFLFLPIFFSRHFYEILVYIFI